jgi:acyl carrier protein
VRAAILALAPQEPDDVHPSDTLTDDLHFDSLALVELAVNLESEFDLRAFQDNIDDSKIDTVGDVEILIVQLVSERAS